jgi:hypothetical protein
MAVVLAVGAWTGVARAADSTSVSLPDTTEQHGARADSAWRRLRLVRQPGATADTARIRPRRGRFDTPRWVMLRSLALPGWGQMHNGSWIKAAVLGGGEAWLIAGLVNDNRRMVQLTAEAEGARARGDNDGYNAAVDAYNRRLEGFVSGQWWLGGLLVYALMDAYVDAHFRDFKVEFEYDRALKGGKPPVGQTRLSLRWAF